MEREFVGVTYTHCKECIYCFDFEKCVKVSEKCADGCKGYFVKKEEKKDDRKEK